MSDVSFGSHAYARDGDMSPITFVRRGDNSLTVGCYERTDRGHIFTFPMWLSPSSITVVMNHGEYTNRYPEMIRRG